MDSASLPTFIKRYFWGDDLSQLSLSSHKKYIIQTLLEKGDQEAIKWLLTAVGKKPIKEMVAGMKLSRKSSNFWNIYLS